MKKGNKTAVSLLVFLGADVNDRKPPLYYACKFGHVEIAKILIEHGADVNLAKFFDKTALHFASENGQINIAQLLIDNGAKIDAIGYYYQKTPIALSIKNGNSIMTKFLLDKGANVNQKFDYRSNTVSPLIYALIKNKIEISKLLIDYGAYINSKDRLSSRHLVLQTV